ncbi:MAG: hypothetical protein C0402_11295, partial [Thermodesulfovibrio sp.]|nr:hypothetical protein [Thermodesulfovibrio sp.]
IAAFLQKAGIPHRPVIAGGRIENFQVEHIWVETQVPYGNYRGAIIDDTDKTWLGLDTSIKIKNYSYNSPLDIYQQPALSSTLAGIKEEYLSGSQTQTPLEYLKTRLLTLSGHFAEDYKSSRALPAFILKILPSSMQFVQKLITHEYTEIPEELKHKVRLMATTAGNPPATLFDVTLNAQQISNQKVVLTYEPETVEDQEILDSHGGLDTTPAYLVRLRPLLKLNTERIVAGADGLPMGAAHNLLIELISPQGIEKIRSSHITGNVAAIGIVAQRAVSDQLSAISEEDEADTILYKLTNSYINRWNTAEEELASLLHLQIARPVPTVVTAGGIVEVSYLMGIPHGLQWKGVYLDANLRAIGVTPQREELLKQKTFMQLSGLQGSVLGHRVLEDDLQVESISTAKLMQLVGNRPPVVTIDKSNVTTVLSGMSFDEAIKEDITNAVNRNLTVTLPSGDNLPMHYEDWSGIGYIKEDPTTGESGYMLSGMLAGGMTAITPNMWKYLADTLGKPYGRDYNALVITSPKNVSSVTTGTVRVTGVILDAHAAVVVNGTQATVSGNAFAAEGITLNRGMNTITATATNYRGKVRSRTIRVKYMIPLKTSITFPFDGAEFSGSSVDVEGLVSDSLAVVEVNGVTATVTPDGRFIARGVLLHPGGNQVTAKATNAEGETDLSVINVTALTSPAEPVSIAITSPQSNAVVNRPSVLVTGTVSTTAAEVSIKVNGVLAEVSGGRFAANQVPLTEGNNTIVVNAIDTNGAVARAELSVRSVKGPYVKLTSNISSGSAPFEAYFRVSTEMPDSVVSYQLDFEGDGIMDYTGATFEDITHDYSTEGIYHPTITVTDNQGNVYTDTIAIIVLNRAEIDALLKGKWEKMKGALANGDIEGAMNLFARSSKEKYRRILGVLKNNLTGIVSSMGDIKMDYVLGGISEYRISRMEDMSGQPREINYFIYFVKDEDGVWKIESF